MTTIDAIKARCEAATPGPWHVNDDNEGMPQEYSPFWVISGDSPETYDGEWYMELHCGRHPDAQFIAAAREDIPYLLERVGDLTAQLTASQQRERAAVAAMRGNCRWCCRGDKQYLSDGQMDGLCKTCRENNKGNWQWRGLQEAGEGER